MNSRKVQTFRKTIWKHWKKNGRHNLPWRTTSDPYKILVSEVMLQQTQVPRVIGKYKEFLRAFPMVRNLAQAPLTEVLKVWSGLGYNRRAKFLHDAAKKIVAKHGGKVPRLYGELVELPGVGDYTAKAVRVFACNEPEVLIETNVRTAIIHSFINAKRKVNDREILSYAEEAAKDQNPREWNWALMDYGSHLKASGVKLNARSAHFTKQSKFEGSLRQVRGAILKAITKEESLRKIQRQYSKQFQDAFASLVREGLVELKE